MYIGLSSAVAATQESSRLRPGLPHTPNQETTVKPTITPTSPDPDANKDQLLNIAQVAHQLNVEVRHIRRLVHERRIPYIKWGHLLRFDPDELHDWIDQYRRQSHGRRP